MTLIEDNSDFQITMKNRFMNVALETFEFSILDFQELKITVTLITFKLALPSLILNMRTDGKDTTCK